MQTNKQSLVVFTCKGNMGKEWPFKIKKLEEFTKAYLFWIDFYLVEGQWN